MSRTGEKFLDLCNVAMTVMVLAISALFFLSFLTPTPVVLTTESPVNGVLVPGSCTLGSLQESKVIRIGNTSVLFVMKLDVSKQTRLNISQADVIPLGQMDLPCTTFVAARNLTATTKTSIGSYSVSRVANLRFGEQCGGYALQKEGLFYFGYYRVGQDLIENFLIESDQPIDQSKPNGVSALAYSLQTVSGPDIDLNSNVNANLDLKDVLARLPEVQFNCQFRPFFNLASPEFGLNVATTVVAVLCLFTQVYFYASKYRRSRGGKGSSDLI
jgi:hypothetical protein